MKIENILRRYDMLPEFLSLKEEIIEAITNVLMTGQYTLSRETFEFESKFANYLKVEEGQVITVANGTDALMLTLDLIKEKTGKREIITTPFTAIPTYCAIIKAGFIPKFVDISDETFLIEETNILHALSNQTAAIMPVHLFGNVFDVKSLRAKIPHDLFIIEDACQAHGSKIDQNFAGTLDDFGCFSFYPTKNLGAYGDGGAIYASREEDAQKLAKGRIYGMVDKDHIDFVGRNSRLDEIQAAILQVKLKYLEQKNQKRNEIVSYYSEHLNPMAITGQKICSNVYSNFHVFVVKISKRRDDFISFLAQNDIQSNIYYPVPGHLQQGLNYLGYKSGDFPMSEKLSHEVVALPLYPEMSQDKIDRVIEIANKFFK